VKLALSLAPEIANCAEYVRRDLGFAIIGFGKMGMLHSGILNLLNPKFVRSVVDRSRLLVLGASRFSRNLRFYRDLGIMLKKETPDAVYVTTPAGSHRDLVSMLLQAGIRHVFVEKPPTTNSSELASLVDMIEDNQIVMVGFQKRYALPFAHAKMLISKAVLGELEEVSACIRSSDVLLSAEKLDCLGRGVLLDLGVHLVDLLLWIFQADTVESASCRRIHSSLDDYFEATLRTPNGVRVVMEATWSNPEYRLPETCIEAHGSGGLLRVSEDYLKLELKEGHTLLDGEREIALYKPHYYQSIPPVNLGDPEYTMEDVHFLSSICSSAQPLTSLRNAAPTMQLVDELYAKAGI
jgi:predicted dehydrogenase